MFPVAMKLSARHLPYIHRLQLTINQFMVLPAVVIVAATGIYQMDKGHWDYGTSGSAPRSRSSSWSP
jgi:hypothetical protein